MGLPFQATANLNGASLPDRLRDQIYRCTRCGNCLAVCPSYQATGDESLAARGRVSLMEAVADGRLDLSPGIGERMFRCLGCLACAPACPSGVNPPEVIRAAKAWLSKKGGYRLARLAAGRFASARGPSAAGLRALDAVYHKAPAGLLPWHQNGQRRTLPRPGRKPLVYLLPEVSPAAGKAAARVAFYPGCTTSLFYQETGIASVRLMNLAGAEVILPRGLRCCGLPLLSLGEEEPPRRAAAENLRILGGLDVDAVVTPCSSCALTLRKDLPRLLGPENAAARTLSEKIMDVHEFLAAGMLPAAAGFRRIGATVTWHDPCHLRFGLEVTAEPREIIAGIPGVKYVETGEEQTCCGGAGLFSFFHYGLALKIGMSKAEEIAASGAEIVATGCPACRMQLTDVLARAGVGARVMHTVELLAEHFPDKVPG